MANHYYSLHADEAVRALHSSEQGISNEEAKKRLEHFGYNELEHKKRHVALDILLNQFKNVFLLLLIIAAGISFFLGSALDATAIVFIIGFTILIGFIQEYRAEKAIEALKKISSPVARVIREGNELKIPAKELVPGDMLVLESGDIVPADARLLEASSMLIDEASLTGESVPSKKIITPLKVGTSVADQENMAFSGTIVTYGKGRGVVTETGMRTELGRIAKSLQTTKPTETPLQKKLAKMAKQIGAVIIALIAIVFVAGIAKEEASIASMSIFALSLAVAAVPNSLPVIVTVGLSMGTSRLAKKKMLIKRLPAAESLGAVTIICSDKTGTVTKNQMTVTDIFANNKIIGVTGAGYEPIGDFLEKGKSYDSNEIELLLKIGMLCNNAKLIERRDKFEIIGDPTEGALVVLGKKGGLTDRYLRGFSFIEELPFDSDRKLMSVIFKNNIKNKKEAYVKGAPDLLLKKCDRIIENGRVRRLTKQDVEKILTVNDMFAKNALRVLGVAYRDVSHIKKHDIKGIETELTFVGLVGMIDPPRNEVSESVKQCEEAGIDVMIITGDYAETAKAVAKKIGLFKLGDKILTGDDIKRMSDDELEAKIEDIRIIARALPIQKLRIVKALQKKGHIVAMTGDGVNDSPALKKADVGVAMGITGTDVAKEVSEATLVDDNFASIVNAISEGRNIYDKMIRSVRYLLSCNSGEIFSVFIAIMLNFPLPLIPLQILLMNLLTDDFPALGLGFEKSDESVMKRPPRNPKERPIPLRMFLTILMFGVIMAAGTLFIFTRYNGTNVDMARTAAFTTLVMIEMFAVISSRSLLPSLKKINPFTNLWLLGAIALSIVIQLLVIYWEPLQTIFKTVPLAGNDLLMILGVSFIGFIVMEIGKFIMKFKFIHKNAHYE